VALERLLVGNFAGAGYFKPFFGTGICFNLWHGMMLFFNYTLLAPRTGGNLWSRLGNTLIPEDRASPLNYFKRSAKVGFLREIWK
jgi:hypothetical protein